MLRDAQFDKFAAVYIVCGHTDLRYGIDSLAAIIETRFHMSLFVPNTLFLFCGGRADRIKGLLWEIFFEPTNRPQNTLMSGFIMYPEPSPMHDRSLSWAYFFYFHLLRIVSHRAL